MKHLDWVRSTKTKKSSYHHCYWNDVLVTFINYLPSGTDSFEVNVTRSSGCNIPVLEFKKGETTQQTKSGNTPKNITVNVELLEPIFT